MIWAVGQDRHIDSLFADVYHADGIRRHFNRQQAGHWHCMEVRLRVVNERASAKYVKLTAQTVIGRSPQCNLRIVSNQVSRKHCVISVVADEVYVRDLASANGTQVNDQTIPPETDVTVEPGSTLGVGPLKFVVEFTQPLVARSDIPRGPIPNFRELLEAPRQDADTKDYVPPANKRRKGATDGTEGGDPSELDFELEDPNSATSIVGMADPRMVPPAAPNPDDTIHDQTAAEHARRIAERLRIQPAETAVPTVRFAELAEPSPASVAEAVADEVQLEPALDGQTVALPSSTPPRPRGWEFLRQPVATPPPASDSAADETALQEAEPPQSQPPKLSPVPTEQSAPVIPEPPAAGEEIDPALQDFFKNFQP
ncbi:MAG: FHA domain-containing protein [Planctomycetales bacterium]